MNLYRLLCLPISLVLAQAQAAQPKLWLRGTHFIVHSVKAGERVEFRLTPRVVKTGRGGVPGYELIDHASRVVRRVPGFEEPTTVSYTAQADGLNALVVKGQRSWYHVDSAGRPFMVKAAQRRALHHRGTDRPLYFVVPKGASRFQLIITCPDKREGATIHVTDPDGTEVFTATDWYHAPRRIKLTAAPEHQGRVWSFHTTKPKLVGKPYGLDDVVVCFSRNIPAFVSTKPEWLRSVLVASGEVEEGKLAPR